VPQTPQLFAFDQSSLAGSFCPTQPRSIACAAPDRSGGTSYGYTVWADFDNDGTRDVLVSGGVATPYTSSLRDRINKVSLGAGGIPFFVDYHDIKGYDGPFGYNKNMTWGVALADVDKDGQVDVYLGRGAIDTWPSEIFGLDWLIKNNLTPTNWNYYQGTNGPASATVDLSPTVGMTYANQFSPLWNTLRYAVGCSSTDFNYDGYADFFVPNYREIDNFFWRGAWNSSFYFDNATDQHDVQSSTNVDLDNYDDWSHGTAIFWYDYDNDGDMDFVLPRLSHYYYGQYPDIYGWALSLWINNGNETFTENQSKFPQVGVANGQHYVGVTAGDYDNDGDMDIYLARSIQPSQTPSSLSIGRLLRYDSISGNYTEVTSSENLSNNSHKGCFSTSFIDYNNDGKLDLFTTRSFNTGAMGQKPELWRNDGTWPGNYLFVELFPPATYNGTPINPDGINAIVQIWVDKNGNDVREAGETLTRQQMGYCTGHMWIGPQPIHFGLGGYDETDIKWVRILWPGISQNETNGWQYIYDIPGVNRTLQLPYPATCQEAMTRGYSIVSDIVPNCYVDFEDLAQLLSWWLESSCGTCGGADLFDDDKVNLRDYSIFSDQWQDCINPEDENCESPWL